jgi:tRNA-dihydrouridine synthase A
MMDCTDRHFRWLMRQISRHVLLYTEMVTHARRAARRPRAPARLLAARSGRWRCSSAATTRRMLAECARIGEGMGYDEVNLNVGCPSDRVASGNFGACLMAPAAAGGRVRRGDAERGAIPVTVKHRIGIDDLDSYEHMRASSTRSRRPGATASRCTRARRCSAA